MIVTEKGKYELTDNYWDRGTTCAGTIPKGTVIEITQIDIRNHKVISPAFSDWHYWDLPVRKIES